MTLVYDFVIVGAGSAGCVLANRLSARGARVALVEAGPDTPPGQVPADVTDIYPRSYSNPEYMWPNLVARELASDHRRPKPFPQARIVGGGSSVMGMVGLRGMPGDYDRWAEMGAEGWDWENVLPAFRRLEQDWDYPGPLHGDDGPVIVRRHSPLEWPPFVRAIAGAAARLGYAHLPDLNGTEEDGIGSLPLTATLTHRVSAASAYLNRTVRARPDLQILSDTVVTGLAITKGRCTAVRTLGPQGERDLHAERVILSAGAIHSPAILLRAGVGPAAELRRLGIEVVADSPGVGAELQNHPVLYLAAHLPPRSRQTALLRPHFMAGLRFASGVAESMPHDMVMLVMNKSSWRGLGYSVGGLGIGLYAPESRGTVTLADPDPLHPPCITFNLLGVYRDTLRMRAGLALAVELMQDREVRQSRNEAFAAGYSRIVRGLNRPGRSRSAISYALAALVDGPERLRRGALRWGIAHGDISESHLRDEGWRERIVARETFGMYHPAGTCRLGTDPDTGAVVDLDGSVYGVNGLSVIDASIMPRLPRGATNLAVMMIAERLAERVV